MKKIIISLIALISLTSCNSKQVHDKEYLQTVFISKKNDTFSSRMSFFDETDDISAEGTSLDELKENSELLCGKTIFTGHTEAIILNGCDVTETLEFMLNDWKVTPSCFIILGSERLLKSDNLLTADNIQCAIEQGKAPECDIITVLSGLLSPERQAKTVRYSSNTNFEYAIIQR